ncbi:MAG: PhoH family protein [Phycisphaerales bacterium]|nr:MAG: PhoH family protein [Phycisphaerales bacterium]
MIAARDATIKLSSEDARSLAAARAVLERLAEPMGPGRGPRERSRQQVLDLIAEEGDRSSRGPAGGELRPAQVLLREDGPRPVRRDWDGRLDVYAAGRPVKPKTENQQYYLEAIRDHDLVFGVGPAGTGKTYLAVAAAVHLLKTERILKIILVRPAVEAGEKLGFLPGGIEAKVNPYLRPLFDALHDMMDFSTIRRFMENDIVEVVPLAFMRGRTLNNAVIILDEAQNSTRGQMQMFLTRMGHGSKMIVTGDTTQIDLPDPTQSGLVDAARRLRRTPGVAFVHLDRADVVRHPLVQRVIEAYGNDGGEREGERLLREALGPGGVVGRDEEAAGG